MKKTTIAACLAILCSAASAQVKISGETPKAGDMISGTVSDSFGPMHNIKVTEKDKEYGNVVAQGVTDQKGRFSFRLIDPQNKLCIDMWEYDYKDVDESFSGNRFDVVLEDKVHKFDANGFDMTEFEGLGISETDSELQGPMTGLTATDGDGLWYRYVTNRTVVLTGYEKMDMPGASYHLVVPSGTRSYDRMVGIAPGAFFDCSSLTSVYIPDGLETIGDCAFRGCPLEAVTLTAMKPVACPENAFDESVYKKAVLMVPKGWNREEAVKAGPAWGKFKNVKESDGLENSKTDGPVIRELDGKKTVLKDLNNFIGATQIPSVTVDGIIYNAGDDGTYAIFTKQTPDDAIIKSDVNIDGTAYKVTSITGQGLTSNTALKSVTIPGSVNSISATAFKGTKLESVRLESAQPIACPETAFDRSVYFNAVLYVPKGWNQKKAAKAGPAWGEFRNVRYF